jgi:hypothetical protein
MNEKKSIKKTNIFVIFSRKRSFSKPAYEFKKKSEEKTNISDILLRIFFFKKPPFMNEEN